MTTGHLPFEVQRIAPAGSAHTLEEAELDQLAVERPLTVVVRGRDEVRHVLAVTMRTPGDDLALAIGLCLSEGILPHQRLLLDAQQCSEDTGGDDGDTTLVTIDLPTLDLGDVTRNVLMNSACGLCGRTAIEDVAVRSRVVRGGATVAPQVLHRLPSQLREVQHGFSATGGLHAVALFTLDGELCDVREDVGRHNALDKVIGRAVREGAVPLVDRIVLVSGRASYELVAKAAVAGVPVLAAIGAPSSMAVDLAQRCGITLVGFLRDARGNVYTHPGRLADQPALLSARGAS